MAKLYFRYGTGSSGKSACACIVVTSYKVTGKNAILLKPTLDDRYLRFPEFIAAESVTSRMGISLQADFMFGADTIIPESILKDVHCIVVDEAQFASRQFIEQLRKITLFGNDKGIPVICYGLRVDFTNKLFEGSATLLSLADEVTEIKSVCHFPFCNKKSTCTLRYSNGTFASEGSQVDTHAHYIPSCYRCFYEATKNSPEYTKYAVEPQTLSEN